MEKTDVRLEANLMKIAREGRPRFVRVGIVLALVLLASCGPALSIHPLYTAKDVVFDPGLLGTWLDPSDSSAAPLVFERGEGNSYKAITQLDGKENVDSVLKCIR